jgi:16S rRNA (cytosine967-C5)-methyltransferase
VLPGGKLVYSTCSIEPDENERQIEAFLSRHPEFQQGETRLELPSENHDGAFACVLLRRA